MIPVTRKELYLNKIVGNDDYDIPEKPISEEELFFAEILGEAVQAPEPLPRYQMYLAKIAGREIEIPYPEVRLEYFLAKAAGMDVETPTPITREEIYWSNYISIVEFEVENVPPLTYKAIEGTLENYRIYGNTVNGENVGDLITEGEHAGEYRVPVTVTNGTDTETTNIYLPEQIKMVGDEAEYVDYGQQKQHRVRKNLLQNTAMSQTINGVTFTVNDDGSVTCSGTAEKQARLSISSDWQQNVDIGSRYTATGCPPGGSERSYYLDLYNFGWEFGNGISAIARYVEGSNYRCAIIIASGYTCDNLTFYPMIRKADITDDTYEPYIENTEVDVTLPALPTLSGTNTLTVGTEVQPSKVYIKGEKEREYT